MTTDATKTLARVSGIAGHWLERVEAEIQFCRFLLDTGNVKPGPGAEALLTKAAHHVARAVATGAASDIERGVKETEALLIPLFAKPAKKFSVFCAGHAHIDMNWMWSWPETVAIVNDTFTTVLKLMEEFPEFCFTQSQASVYAVLEEHNPDLLRKIAKKVKAGRWEVAASHWVENDKNLAGPESLCRHLLHTRAYMTKLFGLSPEDVPIDWAPDTFGHPVTMPSYLVRGGVKYVYLHRPGGEGPERPVLFRWQAPDGSRVLVRNDMHFGYNGAVKPGTLLDSLKRTFECAKIPLTLFVYGVGDHGGGPTRRDIMLALDMGTWPLFPNIKMTSAKAFYEEVEKHSPKLPLLDCELNFEVAGCYTTQSLIKRINRLAENRLVDAETVSGLLWAALKISYPEKQVEEGWRDTLFNHFHDILPGSGVHDTRTYAHGLFQKTTAMTSMVETLRLRELAAEIDTTGFAMPDGPEPAVSRLLSAQGGGAGFETGEGRLSAAEQSVGTGGRPFMVYNPTAQIRKEIVEATVWDNPAVWGTPVSVKNRILALRTESGKLVRVQKMLSAAYWGHEHTTVAFPVEVPPFGYATVSIVEVDAEPDAQNEACQIGRTHHCDIYLMHEREPQGLENELVRVDFDMATGGLASLLHKASGAQLMEQKTTVPILEYGVEMAHPMSAWLIDHIGATEFPTVTGFVKKHKGPYKAVAEFQLKIRNSEFTLAYELCAGDPTLRIRLKGTWFERGTAQTGIPVLRMTLPLALNQIRADYEIPFGAINRSGFDRGQEVPALNWAKFSGKTESGAAGLLLLNEAKHGHSLEKNTVRLSLIRSSYDPDILPEIGAHDIRLALIPFSGSMDTAQAVHAGRSFAHPLKVIGTDVHKGRLPVRASLVSVSPSGVVLLCLKKAAGKEALSVILSNPGDKAAIAALSFNAELMGKVQKAVATDLLERPVKDDTVKVSGSRVMIKVPARGLSSLMIWIISPAAASFSP